MSELGELVQKCAAAAEDVAEYELTADYGYGGELYDREQISNWSTIVEEIMKVIGEEYG